MLEDVKPEALEVKTYGDDQTVFLRMKNQEIEIDFSDFFAMALYVLTNTDLKQDDPRLNFLEIAKRMSLVDGFTKGQQRLGFTEPDTLKEKNEEVKV